MEISANGDQISADLLVVGGGISGITAAIEASELGQEVVLIEKEPFLGGRVARMNQYFPKLCPPTCGLEINLKRLRNNDKVKVLTLTEVDQISGKAGAYQAELTVAPRYINSNCTACEECEKVCQIEVADDYNYGMGNRKAVYKRELAFPPIYVADPDYVKDAKFKACVDACKYEAFDLSMQPKKVSVKVKGVIWATGWKPYDATKMDTLGFGKYDNVITNVMLERLAAPDGPTQGKIKRPSDQGDVKKIGFVQCAGSRDENHLPYCSGVCCAVSLKQATYFREQYPEAEIHIFYIDIRTPGRLEDFYVSVDADPKIFTHRGKAAEIKEVPDTKNLIVAAENTLTGEITEMEMDMVVLATGMVPNLPEDKLPADTPTDEWGFMLPHAPSGVIGAGVTNRPVEVAACVQDATGAVLKALNTAKRS